MITGVYDYVPEDARRPYVTIGEAVSTPDNHHGGFGSETVITLHAWTTARGMAAGQVIADRIVALLDHQVLDVEGHVHIVTRLEMTEALRDPDPTVRHHVMRFRVLTEQE
ncbi:hypothetical protein BBK14_11200 [Parafrankia soli]|uniref:DUF3168 domain-containing protein n=1 Tax=Parafrankia soli TaxID=2599596 RepID=A0A1S1R8V1_9ACTN|nr:DUF3168 domain-containing protein [Parafrankia soli]OHV42181.1 hypothetical protein BBK14_11200 [Parafrankia soli]